MDTSINTPISINNNNGGGSCGDCDSISSSVYIQRIKELERQLQLKQNEIDTLENKWIQKMKFMEGELKTYHEGKLDDQLWKEQEQGKQHGNENNVDENANELVAKLTPDQISRYSRQLLLSDGFGVEGQQKLLSSSVLVVGAGGIGSTVLLYLAASGIGKIIIMDFDNVEKSNLHRQIIHTENNVGMNKAISACQALQKLNPSIECIPLQHMLTYDNALDVISTYDIDCIVDACDNPQTRYICNDACILTNKPLISGSAMGTEGQLTVYGQFNKNNKTACYRCLYPKVNPTEGCKSCSDNGVLGTVPGLIGILQATETIKVLTRSGSTMHDRLLMYDSLRCSFMNVKKPPPRKDCFVCSKDVIGTRTMEDCKKLSSIARGPQLLKKAEKNENDKDMHLAAGLTIVESSITPEQNISCSEYAKVRKKNIPHLLLDVRVKRQFDMCSLSGAVNVELLKIMNCNKSDFESIISQGDHDNDDDSKVTIPIYCICRRGIASTEATRVIHKLTKRPVYNIFGGYNAWVKEVDSKFPMY